MIAQKRNVIITIKESDSEYYLNKGYCIKTDDGKMLKECLPSDVAELQRMVKEQQTKISELEQKLETKRVRKSK